jgi:subtilisin family serine protease
MSMSSYPRFLRRNASSTANLDPTRLLLSFREPPEIELLTLRLAELGLQLEPDADGGASREIVNHTDRRFWVLTSLREPVDDSLHDEIEQSFDDELEWIGPVYHEPAVPGRSGLHCPLPNVLLIEAPDEEVPLREDVERSRDLFGYRYYLLDEPRRVAAYEIRARMFESRPDLPSQSILFENMPLVVPLCNEPADTFYQQGLQWNMTRIRAYGPGQAAWDLTSSGAAITIAILDCGCDLTHPDLLYVPGRGGANGDGSNTTVPGFVFGHGTMCAGIAGATAHNLKGVAGVAGYTCRIMPLAFTNFTEVEAAENIAFAVNNGARVISASISAPGWNPVLVDRAVEAAYNQNVVMCVAAGNNFMTGGGPLTYPATHPHVIACSATDRTDTRPRFANFGVRLSVMAPGDGGIPTTMVVGQGDLSEFGATGSRDYLAAFQGTSAAAPHVAGLAALILSVDSRLTSEEVRDLIEGTADKVGGVAYGSVLPNGTWDPAMGYGRINALDAVLGASPARS